MSKKSGDSIMFECHICGTRWICKRSKYKISTVKTTGGKYWKQYISCCPTCNRDITMTIQFENNFNS